MTIKKLKKNWYKPNHMKQIILKGEIETKIKKKTTKKTSIKLD